MYLHNFSKFSEVDDRYASFNKSKNNVKENFSQEDSLNKDNCKKYAEAKKANYNDGGIWKTENQTSINMAPGCLYWEEDEKKIVRYNSVGKGSCDNTTFYECIGINSLKKEYCKKYAQAKGANYNDGGMWENGNKTSWEMAPGCLYWEDEGGKKVVRYNSVGKGNCDNTTFYECAFGDKSKCKRYAKKIGANYNDGGIWKTENQTSINMAPGCLYWEEDEKKIVRYNSVGKGSCPTNKFYKCIITNNMQLLEKIKITPNIIKAVKDKKDLELEELTNSLSCNQCRSVMTILEPTIIIVYKLWIERAGLSDVISSLVSSVVLGTGKNLAEQKLAEQKMEESGAVTELKLFDESQNDSDLIKKLNEAIERSLFCIAKALGSTVKEFKTFTPYKLQKILKKGFHSFVRCLIITFARLVTMEITSCKDYNSCDIKSEFAKAVDKFISVVGDGIRDRVNTGIIIVEDALKPIAEELDNAGVTEVIATQSNPNNTQSNTGSLVGDSARANHNSAFAFIADGIDSLFGR